MGLIDENFEQGQNKLADLRKKLQTHPAFETNNARLKQLAVNYGFKVIWCPKFNFELNPIEGFFCNLKHFIRKNNDQDFSKFHELIL